MKSLTILWVVVVCGGMTEGAFKMRRIENGIPPEGTLGSYNKVTGNETYENDLIDIIHFDVPSETKITLTFTEFETEKDKDIVEIKSDGQTVRKLSGNNKETITFPCKHFAQVDFRPDGQTARKGFTFNYKLEPLFQEKVTVGQTRTDCGISDLGTSTIETERIVGGKKATLGHWPWIALLFWQSPDSYLGEPVFMCGATVITPRHVITAAHCIESLNFYVDEINRDHGGTVTGYVRLGEYDITDKDETGHQDFEIERKVMHPLYRHKDYKAQEHDIGVITLKQEITFTDKIQRICLSKQPHSELTNNLIGKKAFIAGWGSENGQRGGTMYTKLKEAQVSIVNRKKCQNVWSMTDTLYHSILCVYEPGKSSCRGDSGGPMVTKKDGRWYLRGVVSGGSANCTTHLSMYSQVSYFQEFIEGEVGRRIFVD